MGEINAECIIIMDSVSAHLFVYVAATFSDVRYAAIPSGLTIFVHSIDIALASLCSTTHHHLYAAQMNTKSDCSSSP